MNQLDIHSEFKRLVPDSNMRRYIGGDVVGKKCFDSVNNYYSLFNNILNLTFMYTYAKYRYLIDYDKISEIKEDGNANSNRVFLSLDKLYSSYPLAYDLIQYVLYDIQYDASNGYDDAILLKYIPDILSIDYNDFSFSKYFTLISKWKKSARFEALTLEEAKNMLVELISQLPFLSKTALVEESIINNNLSIMAFKNLENEECCSSYYSIIKYCFNKDNSSDYIFFNLENVEIKEKNLYLKYQNSECTKNILVVLGKNNGESSSNFIQYDPQIGYQEITNKSYISNNEFSKKEIDEIYTINYRYFRNLALAISDAIGLSFFRDSKEHLYKDFSKKYSNIFLKNKIKDSIDFDCNNYNWDNIIIMLLMEASPSAVLLSLIKGNKNIYTKIVQNLNKRFNNSLPIISNKTNSQLEKLAEDTLNSNLKISNWIRTDAIARQIRDKMLNSRKVQIIIKSLLSFERVQKKFEFEYDGNLQTNIMALIKMKENTDWIKKLHFIKITLGETLKRLICFYEGVFSYGRIKMQYDFDLLSDIISNEKLIKYQKLAEDAFMSAVSKKFQELNNETDCKNNEIMPLFYKLKELCECCYTNINHCHEVKEEGKILYSLLGRNEILDLSYLSDLMYGSFYNDVSEDNINGAIETAIKIMIYLDNGANGVEDMPYKYCNAIFPILTHYNRGNINKDGCSTAVFSYTLDTNYNGIADDKKEMSVLTEFEYDLDTDYYCLPNILRTNDNWWIEPLIVDCDRFNNIFIEKEKE